MAISTTALTGRFLVVWSKDPALNIRAENFVTKWKEFLREGTRESLASVPMREGDRPTVFEVDGLSRPAWFRVKGTPDEVRDNETVALGLRAISGDFAPWMHNGAPIIIGPSDFIEVDGLKERRLKADVLDKIFDESLFAELAAAIIRRSRPDPMRGLGL